MSYLIQYGSEITVLLSTYPFSRLHFWNVTDIIFSIHWPSSILICKFEITHSENIQGALRGPGSRDFWEDSRLEQPLKELAVQREALILNNSKLHERHLIKLRERSCYFHLQEWAFEITSRGMWNSERLTWSPYRGMNVCGMVSDWYEDLTGGWVSVE